MDRSEAIPKMPSCIYKNQTGLSNCGIVGPDTWSKIAAICTTNYVSSSGYYLFYCPGCISYVNWENSVSLAIIGAIQISGYWYFKVLDGMEMWFLLTFILVKHQIRHLSLL